MTRNNALKLFDLSVEDLNNNNYDKSKEIITAKFKELIKLVHPDTGATDNVTVTSIKDARDTLISFINEIHSSYLDDICPYCLGEGVIKVRKGFNIVSTICSCVKIKKEEKNG